jgi:hypothetical protein
MNNISVPMDNEIRGYVMLMLMRSMDADLELGDDNQIFEVLQLLD